MISYTYIYNHSRSSRSRVHNWIILGSVKFALRIEDPSKGYGYEDQHNKHSDRYTLKGYGCETTTVTRCGVGFDLVY